MNIIKYNLSKAVSLKFHAFLLIQSLFLPKFFDLGFQFASKVQHVSKIEMGICLLTSSLIFLMVPFLYHKFLSANELSTSVRFGLLISILSSLLGFI